MKSTLARLLVLVAVIFGGNYRCGFAQGLPALQIRIVPAENRQVAVRVEGENGKQYVLQASEDFLDWSRIGTLTIVGGAAELNQPADLAHQFFRAAEELPFVLLPDEVTIFAGDGVFLEVSEADGTQWVFTVNGIVNGNNAIGRIVPSPLNPANAFFSAPPIDQNLTVMVCATDPNDPLRKVCSAIHIRPGAASLKVQPGSLLVGLGGQQTFVAGGDISGSGFTPLRRVYWKVNGVPGGTAEFGSVDFAGLYLAPKVMPTGLPATISVGFSLTPDGAVLASSAITLAELVLTPPKIVSIQSGPAGLLTVKLAKSDGTIVPLGAGDVTFRAGTPSVASVDVTGAVTIGEPYGTSVIEATHNFLGVSDTTVVESRADIHVRVQEMKLRTDDEVNLIRLNSGTIPAIREIEVTRPGVMFNLIPQFFPFRGRVNLFTNSFAVAGGAAVTLVGDNVNTFSFIEGGPTPQTQGIVASIEERSGFVEIGQKPGTGLVTVKYDDGVIQRQALANITFTRLKLEASVSGSATHKTNEAYISEWINLEVKVSNPSGTSSFIGRTPVRVRFANGQKFFVSRKSDVIVNGLQVLPLPEELVESSDLTIDAASGYSTLGFPNSDLGKLHLRISPREPGDQKLIVSIPNDSGILPQELPIKVLLPELQIKKGTPPTTIRDRLGYGATTNSVVVANSYIDLAIAKGPSPRGFPLYPDRASGPVFSDYDPLVWRIQKPDGSQLILPAETGRTLVPNSGMNVFSGYFRERGVHTVSLGLSRRSEVRTADLSIVVVGPPSEGSPVAEIGNAPKLPLVSTNSQSVSPANQLGGVQIVAPTSGAWVAKNPIDVLLQTYNGEGIPKLIGKKVLARFRSSNDPNAVSLTTNYVVAGCWAYYVYGPGVAFQDPGLPSIGRFSGVSPAIPDNNGLIHFQPVPSASTSELDSMRDLVMVFSPAIFTLIPGDLSTELNLPVETIDYLDGQQVGGTYLAIGITDYLNDPDDTFLRQGFMLPGDGIATNPRYLPVASGRIRDAVTSGALPAEAVHASFRVVGNGGFLTALESGLPTLTLGDGLRLVRQTRDGSSLVVTVETDLAYFDSGHYGTRALTLDFPDGRKIKGEVQLVGYTIETLAADHNLPQNAAYGFVTLDSFTRRNKGKRHPDAAVPLTVHPLNFNIPSLLLDLELRSTINACWDSNRNGVQDAAEDLNGDGIFNEADNKNGIPFRGALPVNPLVGFQRSIDPGRGTIQVRQLALQLFPAPALQFYVFGDPTDHRRLDTQTLQLSSDDEPDLLPDFVSRTANGEMLMVRLGSNLVDVLRFTAYNAIARAKDEAPSANLSFDTLRASRNQTYDAYGGLQEDASLGAVLAGNHLQSSVAVYVDHEAQPEDFNNDPNYVGDAVPRSFFAGILDQAFQRHAVGFVDFPDYFPLGRDGRVRPYQPVPGRTATGVGTFGVDLDGGFFDAASLGAPRRPYIIDTNVNFGYSLRLDELPNSPALLALPVVRQSLGGSSLLSSNQLAPALGGTSGGIYSISRNEPGAFAIESRTPGQAVPGLHVGYLLHDKPSNLTDPDLEYKLDDFRDVVLRRPGEPAEAAGAELTPESAKLGNYRVHSVLGFAQNEDKKGPIRTAIRTTTLFKVMTDPEQVTPKNRQTFKLKPALYLREIPSQLETNFNLVVTSQSSGNEKTMKIVADAAVDLVVDVTATVVLSALTEGAYLKACDTSIANSVKSFGVNLALGLMESEYSERYGLDQKAGQVKFVNQLANEGFETPIPGISISGLKDIKVSSGLPDSATRAQKFLSPDFKVQQPFKFADFCALVNLPISKFKDWVKSTYSAETFGGLGSAQAVGTRTLSVCIPLSAQLTNGAYSMFTSVSRAIDILPEEPSSVELSDLPYQQVYGSYPFADEVSDEDFLRRLQAKLTDPAAREAALKIFRDLGRKSVWRSAKSDLYQRYKTRAWRLPGIELVMAPGQDLGNGAVVGDFALTPDETEIPVSSGAAAIVSRSNENAGARALVRSGGYEMILLNGVILDSPTPP